MATAISIFCRFSDGTIAYLSNSSISTGAAGDEIKTSNAGGELNQTNDVSVGQAYTGKTVTHAAALVSTQNNSAGSYLMASFKDAQGKIIVPIQGGGGVMGELPRLFKPVTLSTGITAHGSWQAASDSATLIGSLCIYTSSGLSDWFFATGVDGTNTELVNSNGASLGQSLSGTTAVAYYGVYPSTLGMNNQGAGVFALFVESPEGQLKALIPPWDGGPPVSGSHIAPVITAPFRINQNDKAYINTDT